jgi:transcriptional regulator with PAS, ATPase and Fis domain
MNNTPWTTEFPGAIVVCDREGVILEMNAAAAKTFAADGGFKLVGANMMDCHPEAAQVKVIALLEAGKRNVYTVAKNGVKKLIYQVPWYQEGEYAGFVEFSLEIPEEMPHFIRS